MELRPYQVEALNAVVESEQRGVKRQLIVLPTGAGKTVIFSNLTKFRADSLPMLVLAHREELLHQAKDKILRSNPSLRVEIEQGQNYAGHVDVVVASVPTLGREGSTRIDYYPKDYFKVIVVDEAHHAAATTYRRILDYFSPELVVGVTATPQRGDNVRLTDVFDEVVYYKSMMDLITDGFLCDLVGYRVKTETDISSVATRGGDYVDSELSKAVNNPQRNKLVVDAWKTLCRGQRTIVFAADIAHAESLLQAFQTSGNSHESSPDAERLQLDANGKELHSSDRFILVTGSTPAEDRGRAIRAFSFGQCNVLINVGVFTEGFDEPGVKGIILARPTRSQLLYTQIVGRGTRLQDGKHNCVVVDLADMTKGKRPIGLPSLAGLPPDFDSEGRELTEIAKIYQELEKVSASEASRVRSLGDIELAYKRIDLFLPPPPNPVVLEYSQFIWAEISDTEFYLNYDRAKRVGIKQDALGNWACVHQSGRNDPEVYYMAQDMREAFSWTDKWVLDNHPAQAKLLDSSANWRGEPPTEKQIKFLHRKGIPVTEDMTKGVASQIIQSYIDANPRSAAQEAVIARRQKQKQQRF